MERANEEQARAEIVRKLLGKEREILRLKETLAAKDKELLALSQVILLFIKYTEIRTSLMVRSHVERRCSILGPTQSRVSPSIL